MRSTPNAMQSFNEQRKKRRYASGFEKIHSHIDSAMEGDTA